MYRRIMLIVILLFVLIGSAQAQETYSGYMGDDVADDRYPLTLLAGQTVTLTLNATSGNLDPYLLLENADGKVIAENDDRSAGTLDSYLQYTVRFDGRYTVVVSNIVKTSGDYELTIEISDVDMSAIPTDIPPSIPDTTYTGTLRSAGDEDRYTFPLVAGDALVIRAMAVGGGLQPLDTIVELYTEDGVLVAQNDDADFDTTNSEMAYIVMEDGFYELVVSGYDISTGDYELTITYVTPEEAEAIVRTTLSGPPLSYDTDHFRIHYTLEGDDATTEDYVRKVADTMERVYDIQINQLGWPLPLSDGLFGGDERYDVYLVELISDPNRGELGVTTPHLPAGDNPSTSLLESYATPSYITLDNDYADADGDPLTLMQATAAHEFHHAIHFGYDYGEAHRWYYEATATWMETITFPDAQDATGYVRKVFTYPEICLGVDGDADPAEGLMMYGEWLFIQSLVDAHGMNFVQELWENIAQYEEWLPLERTLEAYGETIPQAASRYRLQNLVRDYAFTPAFDDYSVWLERVIDGVGDDWRFEGKGIQELGANYFELALPENVYHISTDVDFIELYAVGIKGKEASVIPLGAGGNVDTSGYWHMYIMAFNTRYDADVQACIYSDYRISVQRQDASLPIQQTTFVLDASQFKPLR